MHFPDEEKSRQNLMMPWANDQSSFLFILIEQTRALKYLRCTWSSTYILVEAVNINKVGFGT